MVVNLLIAVGLLPLIGFAAAAWATTLSAWVMVAQLWHGARRMGPAAQIDARLRNRAPRIFGASLAMGTVLWGTAQIMTPYLAIDGLRYLALLALVVVGIISYFGIGTLIGAFRLADFKANMRRKKD